LINAAGATKRRDAADTNKAIRKSKMSHALPHDQTIDELIANYVALGKELEARLGVADGFPHANSPIDRQRAIRRQCQALRGFVNPAPPPPIKVGDSAVVRFCEFGPRGDLFVTSERDGTILNIDDDGIEVETPEMTFPKSTIGAHWGGTELGWVDVESDLVWNGDR
jgi:hypothetical protein